MKPDTEQMWFRLDWGLHRSQLLTLRIRASTQAGLVSQAILWVVESDKFLQAEGCLDTGHKQGIEGENDEETENPSEQRNERLG